MALTSALRAIAFQSYGFWWLHRVVFLNLMLLILEVNYWVTKAIANLNSEDLPQLFKKNLDTTLEKKHTLGALYFVIIYTLFMYIILITLRMSTFVMY